MLDDTSSFKIVFLRSILICWLLLLSSFAKILPNDLLDSIDKIAKCSCIVLRRFLLTVNIYLLSILTTDIFPTFGCQFNVQNSLTLQCFIIVIIISTLLHLKPHIHSFLFLSDWRHCSRMRIIYRSHTSINMPRRTLCKQFELVALFVYLFSFSATIFHAQEKTHTRRAQK